jgi:hypothetical protein
MDSLRPVRFLIYITTMAYAFVNIAVFGSNVAESATGFTSPVVATFVGVTQLLATVVGLVVDSVDRKHNWLVKPVFLVLTVAYLYATVVAFIGAGSAFVWIPFIVYSSLCSVVYLSEGTE